MGDIKVPHIPNDRNYRNQKRRRTLGTINNDNDMDKGYTDNAHTTTDVPSVRLPRETRPSGQ